VATGRLVRTIAGDEPVTVMTFIEGGRLRSVDYDGTARDWDVASGRQLRSARMAWEGVPYLSPDGTLAFTAGGSYVYSPKALSLKTWDPVGGKLLRVLGCPE
jgi:hypothetical protein